MQRTLPLPRIPRIVIYYKRRVWTFNTGIRQEDTARRGAQEVVSCLREHVMNNVEPDVKELILWSDSCWG
ncbi:hypothetical protein PR048_005161 [Dryococelus australis]|uniref:Uncharacterized protein n=1 Tax=Dryococelus australis TaxID=614101 RepID=A0ABQ9I7H2_9NEOP|nr:hypothetical protein PR048_005161 [Dryococelus australis]